MVLLSECWNQRTPAAIHLFVELHHFTSRSGDAAPHRFPNCARYSLSRCNTGHQPGRMKRSPLEDNTNMESSLPQSVTPPAHARTFLRCCVSCHLDLVRNFLMKREQGVLQAEGVRRATSSFRRADAAKIFHDRSAFEIESISECGPALAANMVSE
jgi:hypothetical protein